MKPRPSGAKRHRIPCLALVLALLLAFCTPAAPARAFSVEEIIEDIVESTGLADLKGAVEDLVTEIADGDIDLMQPVENALDTGQTELLKPILHRWDDLLQTLDGVSDIGGDL